MHMSPADLTLDMQLPYYPNLDRVRQNTITAVSRMQLDTYKRQKIGAFNCADPEETMIASQRKTEQSDTRQREDDLPMYPEPITNGKLIGFVEAAYANDVSKQRSTTGYVFTYSGGAVVY